MRPLALLVSLSIATLATGAAAQVPAGPRRAPPAPWQGSALPLQLQVHSPEELALKGLAEKQYLAFNLLAGGKTAWDAGDFATAATRWEALLRLPGLPADVDAAVRPFAIEARRKAGGEAASLPTAPVAVTAPVPVPAAAAERSKTVIVRGKVSGGGAAGPGGTVLLLRRSDGPTPKPRPVKGRAVLQRGKQFVPRVLTVPVGSTVQFRNEDEIYHNVFSLTRSAEFDLGLYEKGLARDRTFPTPGPVQLLCNIHSTMQGWVYAVDTPWYAQADADGSFVIKGVPPGVYALEAWNEAAVAPTTLVVTIGPEGGSFQIDVAGDKPAAKFVPDKYGKPRQPQLGY